MMKPATHIPRSEILDGDPREHVHAACPETAGAASRRALDAGLAALLDQQLAGLRPRMAAAAPGTLL